MGLVMKEKSYTFVGFGNYRTCLIVHDGYTDFFRAMPATVKKRFSNTAGIRDMMGENESCKVFALLMDTFEGKGPHRYEVSNPRFKSGFGKCNLKCVVTEVKVQHKAEFFNVQPPQQTPLATDTMAISAINLNTVLSDVRVTCSYSSPRKHGNTVTF